MKFLLWALLIYVAWRWYESKKAGGVGTEPAPDPADAASDAGPGAEKMVACAQCGIHLPQSEALRGAGALHYCCAEHRVSHAGH